MIALKIILIIFSLIIIVLLFSLLLPIKLYVSYNEAYNCKLYFLNIMLYNSSKRKKAKNSTEKGAEEKKKSVQRAFELLKEHNTFGIIKVAVNRLKKLLKHIHFIDFDMKLAIGSEDAAETAVMYGTFSTVFYPLLAQIFAITNFKAECIDISADFDNADINFAISVAIRSQLFFLLAAAIAGFCEYKKIRKVTFYE